ncbi:MAG: phage integrase SAM-like domain-containing protein [Actinomycetota bacterium]|nr:phage integrase SAM-like domain-containing protein [Actinomycetota bacterium]
MVRAGTTFAVACDDWLDYKRGRKIKLSTQIDYEHMVDRMKKVFGEKFGDKVRLEEVTSEMVKGFRDALVAEDLSDRTVNKYLTVFHGLFVWAQCRYKLPANPVANVERHPHAKRGNIDVFSREEVLVLVRAGASDQDGTIYLTAALPVCAWASCWPCGGATWTSPRRDPRPPALHQRPSRYAQERPGARRADGRRGRAGSCTLSKRDEFRDDDNLVFCGVKDGHLSGHKLRDR